MSSLLCQIASLKAALARKDGEAEQFQQPTNNGHVIPKLKSHASSPPIQQRSSTSSGGRKQPKDDSSSVMVTSYHLYILTP
jgi:kinesin family protein C2/C3